MFADKRKMGAVYMQTRREVSHVGDSDGEEMLTVELGYVIERNRKGYMFIASVNK